MTGFETSFKTKKWSPTGSPAIRYLIEHLDKTKTIDLKLIMTRSYLSRSDDESIKDITNQMHQIDGLQSPIKTLAKTVKAPDKIKYYIREIFHAWKIFEEVRNKTPNLIYIDRSNILIAALLARYTKIPVVLRLLGVPPSLQTVISGSRPFECLMRWAFRSPFAYVICTQDGSGGEEWMDKALAPSTTREVLLNGVDTAHASNTLGEKNDTITITFLGRLEELKGADFFVEAILKLKRAYQKRVKINIIGDGILRDELEKRVANSNTNKYINFTGPLPHNEVHKILNQTHIYVSLNRQGHLSNSNLEAISHGCCLIIQNIQTPSTNNNEFFKVFPKEAVITIEHQAPPETLTSTLCQLIDNPQQIHQQQKRIKKLSQETLKSWDHRVSKETELLIDIAQKNDKRK